MIPHLSLQITTIILSLWLWHKWDSSENPPRRLTIGMLIGFTSVFLCDIFYDDFVNLWDERFHSLVAKNMREHLLLPSLYKQAVLGTYTLDWDTTTVWLHKQPFFLWLMSISYKIFGVHYSSGRLPSAILMAWLSFKWSQILKENIQNKVLRLGLLFSLLSSVFIHLLVAGRMSTDHNDAVFFALVSLSFLTLFEFQNNGNQSKLIMAAILSGCAVLTKWLPGLMPLGFWMARIVFDFEYRARLRPKDLLMYLGIVCVIVMPWQLFAWSQYPEAFSQEWDYNTQHFTEAIEGHRGEWYYHLFQAPSIYGWGVSVLGSIILLIAIYQGNYLAISLIVIETFFAFSATKMPSFTLILLLPILLLVGLQIQRRQKKLIIGLSILLILTNIRFDLFNNAFLNENQAHYRVGMSNNRKTLKRLNLTSDMVVFNARKRSHIECMFYTDATAYPFFPSESDIDKVRKAGMTPVIFEFPQDSLAQKEKGIKKIPIELSFFE